jgi:glucose-6-phosphate 1-dehydrogenase
MTPDDIIERFVLFGATGDLAARHVLPAFAALHDAGELPDAFGIVAVGRAHIDDEAFRRRVADQLRHHAATVAAGSQDAVVAAIRYRQADIGDPASVARIVAETVSSEPERPVAAYLALPPGQFGPALRALCAAGLPPRSRVAVEKPFGEDVQSAVALNLLLAQLSGDDEAAAFRVDHFLGYATVQNLLGMRLGNRVLEPVWNSSHVEYIEIAWEEMRGLEDRASYYDRAGQLRDMIQNHLLQVLCVLTMEPPSSMCGSELRRCKVDLLRAVRSPRPARMAALTRRARYTAGRVSDRNLPSYVDEPGVDPDRATETFAEIALEIDNERWAGTRFVLRSGKALSRPRKEIVMRFRATRHHATAETAAPPANELHIGLGEDGAVALHLNGARAGAPLHPAPIVLCGDPPDAPLPPYSRVLLDLLNGDTSLSISGEEAEEAWRIVTPVLQAWSDDRVPLSEYPAGSTGPAVQLHSAPLGPEQS